MSTIAIIPARGGSKRIPRKNIRLFAGKPMIAWPIEAAKKSGLFDRIIISTDDAEISAVAAEYGAEAPFERPANLADDHTGTTAVIGHAVQWLKDAGENMEAVCCIYATAPFVQPNDLVDALEIFNFKRCNFVFSATEFSSSIFRSFRQLDSGGVEMFYPEHRMTRSQDLPVALHDAAQFYWGSPEAWIEDRPIFDEQSFAFKIPAWRVQDIDTEDDWRRAEMIWRAIREDRQEFL